MKLTTTTDFGRGGSGRKEKSSKRIYRTSQNIRIINIFLALLLSESFPSLGVPVNLTSLGAPLGCSPTLCCSLDQMWDLLRFESCPRLVCSCLEGPQLSERLHFPQWMLSMSFYIVHGQGWPSGSHGFNPQLVQLVGKFWVFLSHTAPWVSTVFFFFFSHLCLWVIHWGLLLRLSWRTWVAPVRTSCGGAAAAWVSGVLAAPGTQGSSWPEQQEIQCSGRVWQPVLARTLQYSCLENP